MLLVESAVLRDESFVPAVDSFVRALVVLPEFAPAVGSFVEFPDAELEVVPESFAVLLDFRLLFVAVLASPAAEPFPVGGVALAEGSAAALFLVLLVAVGVEFALSPAVPALSVLDLLREEVVEAPALVELSVPAASFESVFFFVVLAFFEVAEVSPEFACEELAESVESAAGFFFFFLVVESLCGWSVDCVDCRGVLPRDVLVKPNPNNKTIKRAKLTFFFIALL